MVLQNVGGTYNEEGTWWDTSGNSGTLTGSITIELAENRLKFRYGNGEIQITESIAGGTKSAAIQGQGSSGTLFIGNDCLILEYTLKHTTVAHGREERNTDVWMFCRDMVRRSGVIRQADRTIWFEAEMSPV